MTRRVEVYIPDANTALLNYLEEQLRTTGISYGKTLLRLATEQVKGVTVVHTVQAAEQKVPLRTDGDLALVLNDDVAAMLLDD